MVTYYYHKPELVALSQPSSSLRYLSKIETIRFMFC